MNTYTNVRTFAIIAAILSSPLSVIAHTNSTTLRNGEELLCNFAPENSMQIPAGTEMSGQGGIDEKTFNAVIDQVSAVYAPIIKAKGGKLKVNRKWTDSTVNASATRFFGAWTVNMYGGLARHPKMTRDGFAMVMCHELGHHLGGFPQMKTLFAKMSNEGAADYFAALKCFRRVFENEDNASVISALSIPHEVTAGCTKTFKSQKEIALCQRSVLTGKVLADTLYDLGRSSTPSREPAEAPSFSTPSTAQVSVTDNTHPLGQCRLDTMFNASVCGVSYSEDIAADNATVGVCAEEKGDTYGFRPRCWYKPGSKAKSFD